MKNFLLQFFIRVVRLAHVFLDVQHVHLQRASDAMTRKSLIGSVMATTHKFVFAFFSTLLSLPRAAMRCRWAKNFYFWLAENRSEYSLWLVLLFIGFFFSCRNWMSPFGNRPENLLEQPMLTHTTHTEDRHTRWAMAHNVQCIHEWTRTKNFVQFEVFIFIRLMKAKIPNSRQEGWIYRMNIYSLMVNGEWMAIEAKVCIKRCSH